MLKYTLYWRYINFGDPLATGIQVHKLINNMNKLYKVPNAASISNVNLAELFPLNEEVGNKIGCLRSFWKPRYQSTCPGHEL